MRNTGAMSSRAERERAIVNFHICTAPANSWTSCVAVKTLPFNTDVEIECTAVLSGQTEAGSFGRDDVIRERGSARM